ncbi:MAG: type II toxin-antitoxin system PemK/MazF family toxin [Candidatus Moeniiplasma glomeromycotorum]|nr:type II toxin-antitoxin system PemK/MazF family toxin [Candidatus Moeniiplasma glomeromycotorum]MCE8169882.1 type II toxin-antitoxin system PemK/MazF family toxin [Candidatus Moeniiplasma glomeromycotorum]
MNKRIIKRSEVWWVDLGKTVGTEIGKIRPCVAISNNLQNKISSRIVGVPLTSQPVSNNVLHIQIKLANKMTCILPEQIRSISQKRIKWEWGKLGEISPEIMRKISQLLHMGHTPIKGSKVNNH